MSTPRSAPPFDSQPSGVASRAVPSSIPSPHREGTMSSVGSDKHSRIPSGIWRLLIHGNCPRCSHHHKATTIRFKVSEDPSEATPIQCENCEHRWLTIGGRNKTQTSLLSTQTTDPDVDEISFRHALFGIVRSVTALDSVPEGQSREFSAGLYISDVQRGSSSNIHHGGSFAADTTGQGQDTATTSPVQQHQSTRKELLSNNVKLTKILVRDLKRKLRSHFPILNKFHLTKKSMPRTPGATAEPRVAAPTAAPAQDETTAPTPEAPARATAEQAIDDKDCPSRDKVENICTPARSTTQAIAEVRNFDKEALKAMTHDERTAWIREKITAFKCRCSRQCTCKRRRSSSFMVDSSTQVHILPPVSCEQDFEHCRRHSLEGIGSHFDYFTAGEFFTDLPLTVSATRTSEADTIVESNTMSPSPRTSRVDFVQRQRHRSWSPRPASLVNARHSLQHRAQHRLEAQASMDSIVTGAARSSSRGGRRRLDRRSLASLPPPAIPSRPETPVLAHDDQAVPGHADLSHTLDAPSTAPTPRSNEQLTDDERNRTSDPTSPSDPPLSDP